MFLIRETEREFQTDMLPLEPQDMNMVTRSKTILFSTEGGDEHFPPNWHGFFRGRRREGAMLAQRCTGWHFTCLGKSHLNSLTDMSNAFSCTKRETMEEPTNKCSRETSGWLRDCEMEVVFLQGHDGEFTFMVKHGLLMGTSEAPRIFSWGFDKTFRRWKMSHQTPLSMMLSRIVELLRRRLVHQGRGFRPHRGNCERHHPEQRINIGRDAGRGQIQTKSAKAGDCTEYPQIRGTKTPHLAGFGKILGRARHLGGRCSFNGSNKAEIDCRLKAMMANWVALRGFWFARSPWSNRRLIFLSRVVSAGTTSIYAYAASSSELNKLDKKLAST